MNKPTFPPRKVSHKNATNYSSNCKYVQSIILRGTACQCFLDNNAYFKRNTAPGQGLEMFGAGAYFVPYITDEIECRCLQLWDDLPKTRRPDFAVYDLTAIVDFLRLGGAYG